MSRPRHRLPVRGAFGALLVACLGAIGPAPAAALCAGYVDAERVAAWSADPQKAVFVGTAVETRSDGYSALFRVEEVWGSGQVNRWQPVVAPTEGTWLEDNPIWHSGETYLVMAHRRGSVLFSQPCTALGPYASYAGLRPASVTQPLANDRPLLWAWRPMLRSAWPTLLLLVALGGMAAVWVAWLWRREQHRLRASPGAGGHDPVVQWS